MASHNPPCPKCGKNSELETCPVCKGNAHGAFGKLNCSTCNNTGYVCKVHGKWWK
jgi:RecJ-like exonuclease